MTEKIGVVKMILRIICFKISISFHLFLFYTLTCLVITCYCKKYNNFTLYRGIPVNEDQLMYYYEMSNLYDIDFWKEPGALFNPVDFIISPKDRSDFLLDAQRKDLYLKVLIEDVQAEFDKQLVASYVRRNLGSFNWTGYYGLDDIYKWLNDLQKQYPQDMTLRSIGTTIQGRQIKYVRVSLRGGKSRSNVIIEGGIHPREWISPAFVTYMLNEILQAPQSTNQELKDIALTYVWHFVPVLNPDGYEYSHTSNRMWRKNRSKPHGVDLNRNFDFKFGTVGVSFDPYSYSYCGPRASSEKETISMCNLITAHGNNLEYYLSFHSYGQSMIIPYTNTVEHLDNYDEVYAMAKEAAGVIASKYNTKYAVGTAFDLVGYKTSGVSGCWTKINYRVPYVLTLELRDQGGYGFALPPMYILPTCEETMAGVLSFLRPRTPKFQKLRMGPPLMLGKGQRSVLDPVTIMCNMILLIIRDLK